MIPSVIVPKNYKMNPETERLLESGKELRDGMIVLCAVSWLRPTSMELAEPLNKIGTLTRQRVLEVCRWAEIRNVKFHLEDFSKRCMENNVPMIATKSLSGKVEWVSANRGLSPTHPQPTEQVTFDAVYSDGDVVRRVYATSHSWLVRL